MSETVAGSAEIERSKIIAASHRDGIRKAVDAWSAAYKRLSTAPDIIACLQALGDLVLASDMLKNTAEEAEKKLRLHLSVTMSETGGTRIETSSGVWTTASLPAVVDIANLGAVPDEFMTVPAPQPDKARIAAHLKAGAKLNWAVLLTDRGYTARFTPRRKT